MDVLVCSGIHGSELTGAFLVEVQTAIAHLDPHCHSPAIHWWVLPPEVPPYAPQQVSDFFESCGCRGSSPELAFDPKPPLVWLGFSAGVVGAIATARAWQRQGRQTAALIAFDGWGVPLAGAFPIYRFSHDRFTAQTCEWPQASAGAFYAEPAVTHLELWRSPSTAAGVWQGDVWQGGVWQGDRDRTFTTALDALVKLLEQLRSAEGLQQTTPAISL